MTYTNCDPAFWLMGPFMTLAGAFAAYLGLLAWFKPNAKIVQDRLVNRYPSEQEAGPILSDPGFTREFLGPVNMFMFKILGPIIGAVFVTLGVWVLISQVHCGDHLPDLKVLFGPLSWHTLDVFSWLFVIGTGLIGAWNARLMRPSFRAFCVLLFLLFGVAASQAAMIHVGMPANRWGAVALLAIALVGVLSLVSRWLTRHTPSTERISE